MSTDWHKLWEHLTGQFPCGKDSIHGPPHWRCVERNGLLLASKTGAVIEVVRLFAVFHDCRRVNDGQDEVHGGEAADYAVRMRVAVFDLPDDHFELLQYACRWHTHGLLSADPTIGTCWDADRLDLGRAGIIPHTDYMSTEWGRQIARNGTAAGVIGEV